MELQGKSVLITGGTHGIGAATALQLAQAGCHVTINGRHEDDASRATLQQLKDTGARAAFLQGDCSKSHELRQLVETAAKKLGSLEVVIHSAGGLVPGKLMEVTEEAWLNGFAVHVHAAFHLAQSAYPLMKKSGEGAFLFISSSAGLRGLPANLAYQTVKGALPQFTRALARELAEDNIRANCVAPGVIRTRFHDEMPEEVRTNNLKNRIPLHREGTPEQVASLILELVRNEYITGETVSIDGGLTMRIA